MSVDLLCEPSNELEAAAPSRESPAPSPQPRVTRVLHIINGDHYAGAERVQDLLAARLPEHGFEAAFALLKGGAFAEARAFKAAKLYDTPMRSRLDVRQIRHIADVVRREEYALIHAHTARSALIGRLAAAMAGVPMVYHVHSPTIRNTTNRAANIINTLVERASLVGVPRMITVSNSLAGHMRTYGISSRRITVVHNGVPGPAMLSDRAAPTSVWTLGVVALFRPRKGLEVLLDALALLRSYDYEVRLRAVGKFETPEYEAEIKARSERLQVVDAIEWTGFTRDVQAELRKMDLFVLPSLFGEGLPMVVLEAMAHGVPVVGTRVEGVPEAIREGIDGVLANPGDAADLASAIRQFLDGQANWQTIRESAHARHQADFSDAAMASRVAGVYRDVLAAWR
jgi:glycosyltransferase involved in cell wall biosynthesis